MKTYCNYFNKALILLLFVVSFISCVKEPDSIGLDLQPIGDKLNVVYTDTCSIVAYSIIDDSLRTDNYSPTLLGSIVDPIFGVSTANIFTQIRLSNNNVSFGNAPIFDSLILTLPYTGIYNYNMARACKQHIQVFEVTDPMSVDSVFYSNKLLSYDRFKVLADMTFTPDAIDSVTVAGVKYPALIRIKFNSYFGNKLLYANGTDLLDNTHFNDFIKGLYIKTDPLSPSLSKMGSIMYFNLLSSLTNLKLYYKNRTSTGTIDTTENSYSFLIDNYCGRDNYFDHNGYKDATDSLRNQLGMGMPKDTTLGKQSIYLQSMGGIKVKLLLPYISNLVKNNKKVVINEAVLVFQNADANDFFTPPTAITMLKLLAGGATALLPDLTEGSTFFDGTYNASTREYKIRITRYLQQMLNSYTANPTGFVDYGLELLIDNRRTTANRVKLKGTNPKYGGGVKLQLKYNVLK